MAILTNTGRAALAKLVKENALHLAWGSGDPAWDTTPVAPSVDTSALTAEIGRRRVSDATFCTPDPNGTLVVPEGNFAPSETPTKYLYMRYSFAAGDSPEGQIRELGVFVGTVAQPTVPSGQFYLLPDEILDPGMNLTIEHIAKIERSPSIRQQFEIIVQF